MLIFLSVVKKIRSWDAGTQPSEKSARICDFSHPRPSSEGFGIFHHSDDSAVAPVAGPAWKHLAINHGFYPAKVTLYHLSNREFLPTHLWVQTTNFFRSSKVVLFDQTSSSKNAPSKPIRTTNISKKVSSKGVSASGVSAEETAGFNTTLLVSSYLLQQSNSTSDRLEIAAMPKTINELPVPEIMSSELPVPFSIGTAITR